MAFFNTIKQKNKDLFVYQTAEEVHTHDSFFEKILARCLPECLTPNKITLFRVILTPAVFFLVLHYHYKLGFFLFLLAAFTDVVDGSIARTRGQVTKFGMLFDPLADKLLIGSMVVLLVFRYFSIWLGIIILAIEIFFMLSALWVRLKFRTVRMANVWGKIKMLAQVFAMSLTMVAILIDEPILLTGAFWVFGISIGFAVLSLFRQGV